MCPLNFHKIWPQLPKLSAFSMKYCARNRQSRSPCSHYESLGGDSQKPINGLRSFFLATIIIITLYPAFDVWNQDLVCGGVNETIWGYLAKIMGAVHDQHDFISCSTPNKVRKCSPCRQPLISYQTPSHYNSVQPMYHWHIRYINRPLKSDTEFRNTGSIAQCLRSTRSTFLYHAIIV